MCRMKIKDLFEKPQIIGLVANAHEGKSNLLYHILDHLSKSFSYTVYTYGLKCEIKDVKQIHSVQELEQIRDSIIIIDEMFSLFDLDNRKVKAMIENTIRLVFHNNNVLLLCGLAENFKKFLSAKLNVVIFKKTGLADLINGSTVKNIVMAYKGVERGTAVLDLAIDEALIFDGKHYKKIPVPYMKQYDTKANNKAILTPLKQTKKPTEVKQQTPKKPKEKKQPSSPD